MRKMLAIILMVSLFCSAIGIGAFADDVIINGDSAVTEQSSDYTVSYSVTESYSIKIPAITSSMSGNSATVGLSGSANLPSNKTLYVTLKQPSNGFNLSSTTNNVTIPYTVSTSFGSGNDHFTFSSDLAVGMVSGSGAPQTFNASVYFKFSPSSSTPIGTYYQTITFVSSVVTDPAY